LAQLQQCVAYPSGDRMADNTLFRELCKPDVLLIGWHLAHADSRDDFVADPVGYEDLGANLASRLAYLLREISHERYRPRYPVHVDVPKSGLSVRPGTVLPMEEAALLHAITYLIAPRLDRHLSSSVYSFRLQRDWQRRVKKGRSMFREGDAELPFLRHTTIRKIDPLEPWYLAWPEFDRERVALVRKKGYTHLTRTDISAFFENIDLGVLEAQLRALLPKEPLTIALLMRILGSWTHTTSAGTPIGRGIPQGNDVSSFLANLYLLPLDRALNSFCRRNEAVWLRYVDDVEVYSKTDRQAREVVLVVNESLRRLWLNLQGSKTEVLSGAELERELSTASMSAVDLASKEIDRLDLSDPIDKARTKAVLMNLRPLVASYKKNMPAGVQRLEKKRGRILRRLFTIYGRLGRRDLLRVALAVLAEPPELRMLLKALRYLERVPYKYHDALVDSLLALLDGEVPLLPFHVAAILDCVRHLHPTRSRLNIAVRITGLALRRRTGWHVRQKALQLLSTLPSREETALKRALNALAHWN
jgi:hypothetical protein